MSRRRARFGAALALAVLLGAGCAQREVVLGLYDVPARALPQVASAGFDVVTISSAEKNKARYLDEARKIGLQVLASPDMGSAAGREKTARWDDHPAVWGWYLYDEPDLNIVSPRAVLRQRRSLEKIAQKPSLVVVASGAAVERYRGTADHLMVDCYPIAWAPLAIVSREMRTARLAAEGRPFYAVLQAFDWGAYPDLLIGEEPQRPPTFEEMRCMAFLSLFQGAHGIFFYSYQAGAWSIEERPAVWSALVQTAAELRKFGPMFARRVAWWPAESRYGGAQPDMYNEIHEGRISLGLYHVRRAGGPFEPGYYFAAINTAPESCAFSFRLPFQGSESAPMLAGHGEVSVQDGWASKVFEPFEVCIMGPFREPLQEERTN